MQLLKSIKGNFAHFQRWCRKRALALVKSNGLELVRLRRRGARRAVTRLVRVPGAALAAPAKSIALDPERLFTVEVEARPGINHLRHALELLILEAVALGRTPVAFKPWFDPRHNLGHDLDVNWDKYLDLSRVELSNGEAGTTFVRVLQPCEVPGLERLSAAWFDQDHRITDDESRGLDLIVRRNRTGLHIKSVHGVGFDMPGYRLRFTPSALVSEKFRIVKERLGGDYTAMHVRRDDMLAMTDLYPNLGRDTQPDRIRQTLRGHVPQHSRVYVMTNERDRQFFEPLRADFEIFQYFDFLELNEILDSGTPDNFLLFEIEKLLFEHAATKVYTFTHPEGGQRISLSVDKGWA